MTGSTIISELKNLQDIPNADRIQQATIYGETVIVSKDHKEGELGILFDMETQLSHEFCHYNNLYQHSHFNEDQSKKGYIANNRRVRPIRLKGIQCSGFWVPISYLSYIDRCFGYDSSKEDGASSLKEGNQFTEIGGKEICKKWVPVKTRTKGSGDKSKKQRVSLAELTPTFKEHVDTDHWARNKHVIKLGDVAILLEKLHGTSARAAYLRTITHLSVWKKIVFWLSKALVGEFVSPFSISGYDYRFIVGSRRTVKSIQGQEVPNKKHYYDSDLWTKISKEHFEGKLEKGEVIYFEIVGYTPEGKAIMGTYSNEKLKNFMDKEEYKGFIDRYGKTTVFTYGCPHNESYCKIFVYRITHTNEDGVSIDLSWEQVKQRCEKLGVYHVPELHKGMIGDTKCPNDMELTDEEFLNSEVEMLNSSIELEANSDSISFPQHLREGVVVRIEHGGLTPTFLKHKGYYYRVLEGQIKEPTMEDEN